MIPTEEEAPFSDGLSETTDTLDSENTMDITDIADSEQPEELEIAPEEEAENTEVSIDITAE